MRESVIKRIEELIDQGKSITSYNTTIEWGVEFRKWRLSCLNILERTFGKESDHYQGFKGCTESVYGNDTWIPYGTAYMESAKEEVEKGFLYKIEHLVSADLFDSILEHAEYLLSKGHKDPAAILGRVVIEKTLKQIAERETIALSDKEKLSRINEILWKEQAYDKITWRLIQGYVDLGNFAAHGDFDKYDKEKVEDMLSWIRKNLMSL